MKLDGVKSLFETKFVAFGMVWSVWDWSVFIIVIVLIIVILGVGILFCCLIGDTKENVEKEALENVKSKREMANMDEREEASQMHMEALSNNGSNFLKKANKGMSFKKDGDGM